MRYLLPALLALVLSVQPCYGNVREKKLGIGIAAGDLSGISIKTWRGRDNAIDAVLSWRKNELKFSVSYLNHFFEITDSAAELWSLYYGLGTRVRLRDDDSDKSTVGLRFPGGLSYIFSEAPLDVFFEIAPVVGLVPDTRLYLTAIAGIRYYF